MRSRRFGGGLTPFRFIPFGFAALGFAAIGVVLTAQKAQGPEKSNMELVGWSDNSRYLASCTGNDLVLWDFSGRGPEGTKPVVLSGHTDRIDAFAWQSGGEHFVSGGRDWRLNLWRPGKATQPLDVQMLDSEITATRWSADGKWLAVGEKKGRVTLFELVPR